MAGYIGSKASVVSSGAERKKVFDITATTTSLTGCSYTPNQVHVYHNGVRLVDGTDYTATDGSTVTLTTAAQSGDEVVVISYATFQTSDTVSASAGGTFSNAVTIDGDLTVDTNTLFVDSTNNRVGVRTTSPVDTFHAVGSDGATSRTTYQGATEFIFENNGDFSIDLSTGNANQAFINWHDTDAVQQGWLSYNHSGDYMRFGVNGAERMRIDSSGDVLVKTVDARIGSDAGAVEYGTSTANSVRFYSSNTERMRITSTGQVLIGRTATSGVADGHRFDANGFTQHVRDDGNPLELVRETSDGKIVVLKKDTSIVGSIGVDASRPFIASSDTGIRFAGLDIMPCNGNGTPVDNQKDVGSSIYRWDDVYATNGTIQTSDRNEKQDIEALSDAEQRVAVAAKGLLRKYRWKDAVAEKGDAARIHFGIIAQDLQAAFEAEGLDAGRYGMFISSTWWEAEVEKTRKVEQEDGTTITETYTETETYDEPTEGATERTRLGVRYPELLAFIIAAL